MKQHDHYKSGGVCNEALQATLHDGKGSNGKSLLATVIKNMQGKANVFAIAFDKLGGDRFSKQNLDYKLLNI